MTAATPLEKPDVFSLALNVLPFAHLASGVALAFAATSTLLAGCLLMAAWIYLMPPLVGRATLAVFGVP